VTGQPSSFRTSRESTAVKVPTCGSKRISASWASSHSPTRGNHALYTASRPTGGSARARRPPLLRHTTAGAPTEAHRAHASTGVPRGNMMIGHDTVRPTHVVDAFQMAGACGSAIHRWKRDRGDRWRRVYVDREPAVTASGGARPRRKILHPVGLLDRVDPVPGTGGRCRSSNMSAVSSSWSITSLPHASTTTTVCPLASQVPVGGQRRGRVWECRGRPRSGVPHPGRTPHAAVGLHADRPPDRWL
jgi:hypothetical protein